MEFRETSQNFNSFSLFRQLLFSVFSMGCLTELKLCEVSRNSFSNLFWKFQLSIVKNKKVLFLKKYFLSRFQYQNKKAFFTGAIFPKVLVYTSRLYLHLHNKHTICTPKREAIEQRFDYFHIFNWNTDIRYK